MKRRQREALFLGPMSSRPVSGVGTGHQDSLERRSFGHSLILGEHCPREAIAGGAVDQLQGLLVLVIWVDIHSQHRPEDLLGEKPKVSALPGPAL